MELEKSQIEASKLTETNSRRSHIVKTLTANDVLFWGADAFIYVALALFVTSYVEGATILNVGIGLMIHRVTGALASVPIGRWFDRNKGYADEVLGLSLACLGAGFVYFLLSFSSQIWQFYLAMFCLGLLSVINLSSWRILFYSHIESGQLGQTIGVYQMMFSLGIGLFMAVAGFTGERFGYDKVLMIGGLIMMVGSSLPLLIRDYFVKKK